MPPGRPFRLPPCSLRWRCTRLLISLLTFPLALPSLPSPPCSASSQLDLLGLLRPLLAAAADPELSLGDPAASSAAGTPAHAFGGALNGGQVVAAGWHAAAVAASLCGSGGAAQQQQLQDAAVARGLLPLLARFVTAEVATPPAGAGGGAAAGARAAEQLMATK